MSFLKPQVIHKQHIEPQTKPSPSSNIKQSCPFAKIANFWLQIENTTKRLEKLEQFSKLLIFLDYHYTDDIPDLLLLISNYIRNPWDTETSCLNCGEQLVKKSVQEAFSIKTDELKNSILETGDLAISCEKFKKRQPKQFIKPKPLTLYYILEQFRVMADQHNQNDRMSIIKKILMAGSSLEDRYVIRLLVGKNRLGLQRKTILCALGDFLTSKMLKLGLKSEDNIEKHLDTIYSTVVSYQVSNKTIDAVDEEESDSDDETEDLMKNLDIATKYTSVDIVKIANQSNQIKLTGNPRQNAYFLVSKAFAKMPSLPQIAEHIDNLRDVHITPFIPILPMLAKPASSYDELFELGHQFFTEYKYDGFRAQIHFSEGKLQIFSRSQENMSDRFPDVLASVKSAITNKESTHSFILDGEIVPINEDGVIQPFQMLARRLKQYDPAQGASLITYFNFDIMMFNGTETLNLPFFLRRQLLQNEFSPFKLFQFANQRFCKDKQEIEAFLQEAVSHKTEGLIVKTQFSTYSPDRRSKHWTKLKKDYLDSVGDSFDLVPVAGWYGKGKRTGVIGSYLLACQNGDKYQTLTCAGTGMTDEFLQAQTFDKLDTKPSNVQVQDLYLGPSKPDFWIAPEASVVWEIKVANLSLSKMHTCHYDQRTGEGIAARLPRLIRVRDDKPVENCTTAAFIYERFNAQPDRGGKGFFAEKNDEQSEGSQSV